MYFKTFAPGLMALGLFATRGHSLAQPATLLPFSSGSATVTADAQAAEKSMFGEPLFVNGKRVTDNEIKRFLIYGPCRLMLEMYRVGMVITEELNRRANDSAEAAIAAREKDKPFETPEARQKAKDEEFKKQRSLLDEKLLPTPEEFDAEFKRTLDEFKANYPVLDTEAEVSRAFRNVDWYRTQLQQTLLFDRVFYPENPEDWPITTVESVRADSGDVLLTDAKDSYKMRKEHADKTGEPLPKEDGVYTQMMRQIVRDAMFNTIDFRTSFDGLPDTMVLWADTNGDGKPELEVTTDELWKKVADTVTPTEIQEAKQWFVTFNSVRDRMRAEGTLLNDQEVKEAIKKLNKQFEGTYFNIDILATQTHYFPSTESYKDYYTLLEGYRKALEPKLAKEASGDLPPLLRDYVPTANNIMGLGQVDVEIMLVSAFDIPHFKWKPDGWKWAKGQAEQIKKDIDANIAEYNAERAKLAQAKAEGKEAKEAEVMEPYRFWTSQMDDHSEYWDPPPPEKGRASDVAMKKRGRFGLRYRNDLQGFVGETPYSHWVTGDSITDYTFSTQAEGTVAGPFKGPLGYYLTRVQRRTPPTRPLNLGDPKHVELLKEDYLRVAFVEYGKEAVAKATIKGF